MFNLKNDFLRRVVGMHVRRTVRGPELLPDAVIATEDSFATAKAHYAYREAIVAEIEAKVRADLGQRCEEIEALAVMCAGVMRDNGQETLAKAIENRALIFKRPPFSDPPNKII